MLVAIPTLNEDELRTDIRGDPLDAFAYDMNRIYPGSAGGRAPSGRRRHTNRR